MPLGVAPEEVPPERASPWRTNECPSVVIVVDPGAALLLLLLLVLRVRLHQDHHVGRHIHQLFHHLRGGKGRAQRAGWQRDLGHCDNLVGHRRIDRPQHGHQLVHHLRLKNTESRHDGSNVTNLLRGVPQNPLLRPRLSKSLGPATAGLFIEQLEEHRLGRRSLPDLGRVLRLALLLPGPGLPLSS